MLQLTSCASTHLPDAEGLAILTQVQTRALNAAACCADLYEPFVGWIIEQDVLDSMIALGLLERGPSCRPAVGKLGYRLTLAGWKCWKGRYVL